MADHVAFHDDVAGLGDFSFEHRVLSQAPHQHAGPAIDEAVGEPLVKRIGKPVFHTACDALPVFRVVEPIRPVRREGPGADLRNASRQRVYVTFRSVRQGHLFGEPVGGEPSALHEIAVDGRHEVGMRGRRDLAIVGKLAGFPQPLHRIGAAGEAPDRRVAGEPLQHQHVVGGGRTGQPLLARGGMARERFSVSIDEKSSAVLRHCSTRCGSKLCASSRSTSSASKGVQRPVVPKVPSRWRPAGPAGDLRQLARVQPAELPAVELHVAGEGDMVDVEVQPHADGVGGDEIVDVAILVHGDLGVAGARGERAEHHRRAAALAADQLGDGVDLVGREGDDGRAPGQAGDLLLAGEGEVGRGAAAPGWRRPAAASPPAAAWWRRPAAASPRARAGSAAGR